MTDKAPNNPTPSALPFCWANGSIHPVAEPVVSALDRGLLYGDGLFDTLRIWKAQPLFWEDHWSRLQRGMKSMALPISEESGAMQHHLQELLDRNAVRDAIAMLLDGSTDQFTSGYNQGIRDAAKVVYDCKEAQM
ncbi:MAG: hypothetical protein EBU26_13925, partial [Verrucomicrobia bacterium]|nr:hypothetical protein [Verrucomicrobiota bacterium]